MEHLKTASSFSLIVGLLQIGQFLGGKILLDEYNKTIKEYNTPAKPRLPPPRFFIKENNKHIAIPSILISFSNFFLNYKYHDWKYF